MNNLKSNVLSIGQELYIPPREQEPIIEEPSYEKNYIEYIVQKGDSLWQISRKYNVTVKDIIEYNNLDDLTLHINQIIKIPVESNREEYTVQKGDTLWSIAKNNNVTIDELKSLNNLDSNLLSIGQKLIIK